MIQKLVLVGLFQSSVHVRLWLFVCHFPKGRDGTSSGGAGSGSNGVDGDEEFLDGASLSVVHSLHENRCRTPDLCRVSLGVTVVIYRARAIELGNRFCTMLLFQHNVFFSSLLTACCIQLVHLLKFPTYQSASFCPIDFSSWRKFRSSSATYGPINHHVAKPACTFLIHTNQVKLVRCRRGLCAGFSGGMIGHFSKIRRTLLKKNKKSFSWANSRRWVTVLCFILPSMSCVQKCEQTKPSTK